MLRRLKYGQRKRIGCAAKDLKKSKTLNQIKLQFDLKLLFGRLIIGLKMRHKELFLVILIPLLLVSVSCQEDGEEETQETTTEPYIDSTTTEAPPSNLENLDYRVSMFDNFFLHH